MKYEIEFSDTIKKDIKKIKKSGDQVVLKKLYALISELKEHPKTGTGKPEQLKYYKEPTWSRRISAKHRLIYEIQEDKVVVFLISAYGHYDEK